MEYKLEEICEFIRNGASIKQDDNIIGYPITRRETIANSYIDLNRMGYAGIVELGKFEEYLLSDGDILMSHINSEKHLGKTAIYENCKAKIIHGMNLLCLRPRKELVIPKYLNYYFNNVTFRKQLPKITKKSVNQASFSVTDLKNIKISLPKKDTQIKIVGILDKAQELIDKRKEQIGALDELVKSKFIEMFGDPSTNEKGWEIAEIGKYLDVLTDYHSNGSYETLRGNVTLLDTPNYALMVRTTDLENNNFEKDVKYIDEHAYNHLEKSKVFGGEIIINKIGSAGKVYLMPFLNRPVSLAMNQFLLRFDELKINHIFLYNLLLTPYMESKIREKVRGAVTKTITKDAVREINVIVPPIELQNNFVDFVQQVDKLKVDMQKSLKELEDNFNSLMQKAFKGELFN